MNSYKKKKEENKACIFFQFQNTAVNTSVYTFKGNNFEATDKDIYPENNVTIRYAIQVRSYCIQMFYDFIYLIK